MTKRHLSWLQRWIGFAMWLHLSVATFLKPILHYLHNGWYYNNNNIINWQFMVLVLELLWNLKVLCKSKIRTIEVFGFFLLQWKLFLSNNDWYFSSRCEKFLFNLSITIYLWWINKKCFFTHGSESISPMKFFYWFSLIYKRNCYSI